METINKDGDYEAYIYSLREAFAINDNEIIFIGDNGGISAFGGDNALKYNVTDRTLKEICSGKSIKRQNGKLIVTHFTLVKEGSCMAENEYFDYDVYCDYNGNVIDGTSIYNKGGISKYPIEMFFHCLEGKITGWYRYAGRENYMTIKGKMNDNNEFSFIEYDEKGKSFATFTGKVDFAKETLHGTFSHNNKRLNFWVGNLIDVIETMEVIDKTAISHFGITMEHPVYFQETNRQNNRGNVLREYKWDDIILSYVFLELPSPREIPNKDIMNVLLKGSSVDETITSSYDEEGAYCSVFKSGSRIVLCKTFNKGYKSYGVIYFSVPMEQEKLLYMMNDRKLISYRFY